MSPLAIHFEPNLPSYSESTHSMDPAMATVDGNLPGVGESIVYFLLTGSIAVLAIQIRISSVVIASNAHPA